MRCRRDDEGERENREGDHEVKLETGDLRFDLPGRRGNLNEIDSLIAGIDDAFDHAQQAVIRPFRSASAGAADTGGHAGLGQTRKLCRE